MEARDFCILGGPRNILNPVAEGSGVGAWWAYLAPGLLCQCHNRSLLGGTCTSVITDHYLEGPVQI